MPEPITICAGALGAVANAIDLGIKTYNLIDGIKSAPENIKRLGVDLQGLYHVLGLLAQALEAQNKKSRQDSLPVHMIANIKELLDSCIKVFKEINKCVQPFIEADGSVIRSWGKGIKWEIGKKANMSTLQKALSNNKATLELAISTLNFFNSSQTVEMVVHLQRDVRRLRRQMNQRDHGDAVSLNTPNAHITQQSPAAQNDPYSIPMQRFLARTASVASRVSVSTRITELDSIFSDDVSEATEVTAYAEISTSEINEGLNAEYYVETEKDSPHVHQTEVGDRPPDQSNTKDISDIEVPKPTKQSTWKKFRDRMKRSTSRNALDSVPETDPQASTSNPPSSQPTPSETPYHSSLEPATTSDHPPITLCPPTISEPTSNVPTSKSATPIGTELTKTMSTPSMPFHGQQTERTSATLPHRSATTPLTTLSFLPSQNTNNSLPPPQNPYTLSGYGHIGDTLDDPDLTSPTPTPNDRDTLLSTLRQPSPPSAPATPKTDSSTPCRVCNSAIQDSKHYLLSSSVWHTSCFRCTSCNILLPTSPPPFLLKDDFLVCSSCSFNCQKCDARIEEHGVKDGYSGTFNTMQTLATTPGQLDCPGLFFCHEYHRSIKNLRYARTSQGVFCLACHPTTMSEIEKVRRERQREKARPMPLLVG
ncbi:hypothetical protein K469DRAFT_550737 [Zopfia rhizophila CBS 207.26]|uniref:LIM zinc-binding domain-containing protein n=1 Tax=Zopfia rhizophila CBS 207.26 TaxID=1314779 RepID=A0A6A6EQG0_9PEZI|nr:hypothetical protein K469DRAFT_550737 [Zopfia rhizophila CBS 207.26]